MIRKFYTVVFPGDQWYLRDTVLPDGKQAFTFNTFLKANIERYVSLKYVEMGLLFERAIHYLVGFFFREFLL